MNKNLSWNILVFNNNTGIVQIMEPLFAGEGLNVLVAETYMEVTEMLDSQDIHLLITDVELKGKGF